MDKTGNVSTILSFSTVEPLDELLDGHQSDSKQHLLQIATPDSRPACAGCRARASNAN